MPNGHGVSSSVGYAGAGKSTPALKLRVEGIDPSGYEILLIPCRLEKLRLEKYRRPYRTPPLVGWDKSPKVFELTSVKELDKRAQPNTPNTGLEFAVRSPIFLQTKLF